MKPPGHAAVSLGIGAILFGITRSPYSLVAAFATGVMIDLDHLVEYYLWFVKGNNSRIFFFVHSYELLVPVFLAGYLSGWDPVVIGVSFGFLGHLITDQLVNPVVPLGYFFTYRAVKKFRRSEIINAEWEDVRTAFMSPRVARAVLGRLNRRLVRKKPLC